MAFLEIFSKKKEILKANTIIVDSRESSSSVPSELKKLGINIEFQSLPIGDYIVNETIVERKTIPDLNSSIIDKRLNSQVKELQQHKQKLLIIEGNESDLYSGALHENAIRGFILSATINYNIPIVYTSCERDTAKYLKVLSNKKQKSEVSIREPVKISSAYQEIQFILEGFKGIGPVTAKKLIKKFKTLQNIFSASNDELSEILGNKTESFKRIISRDPLENSSD